MISVEAVTLSFGKTRAVDGVSLQAADGETLVVTGPSGSGKTTLLRIIAGLDRAEAGTVTVDGRVVSGPGTFVEPWSRGLAMVFQRPALWPHMTVEQNVAFGLGRLSRAATRSRTRELLDAVGLADLARRRGDDLSAGQARRVALARALAPEARHVLMDEPLVNLDPDLKAAMLRLLRAETARTGATLIYVAHDQDEMAALGGRVVRLERGRLVGRQMEGI